LPPSACGFEQFFHSTDARRRRLRAARRQLVVFSCRSSPVDPGPRSGEIAQLLTVEIFGDLVLPNLASAKKNMRKSRAAAIRNRAQKSALRTALKRAASGSAADRQEAVKLLDRAARKGLIHKNAAARHKSQLARAAK